MADESTLPEPWVLVVVGDYYSEISEKLVQGARDVLDAAGVPTRMLRVPGALEIPPAIALHSRQYRSQYRSRQAKRTVDKPANLRYGYVALGCVIRGETAHFDIVANESARGLMELGVHKGIPIGNGILTVDTKEQALARCSGRHHKGAEAAHACLALMRIDALDPHD